MMNKAESKLIEQIYDAANVYLDDAAAEYKRQFEKDFPNDEMSIEDAKACIMEGIIESMQYDFCK